MKYIKQALIILLFSFAGEILQAVIPLPIPAAIYGIVLLLGALCTGLLQPAHIDDTARFLLELMPLLFVAPAVNILQYWGLIRENLVPITVIVFSSTVVVFAVSGLVTKLLLKKGGKAHG